MKLSYSRGTWRGCSLGILFPRGRVLPWMIAPNVHIYPRSHYSVSASSYSYSPKPKPNYFPNYTFHHIFSRKFTTHPDGTNTNTNTNTKCWKCNSSPSSSSQPFLVCHSCRSIQPLDPQLDYFHIFHLDRKYDIDESSLEGKYKDWQKKLHPDLVHSKSESEREYAAEQSARVIDAYRTLGNPLARAIYLMKLQGVHVDEEQTVSDPELLAEIMEIRESVEEATDAQSLKKIQTQVLEKMKQWSESFAAAFKSQDTEEALNAIRRMTYYKRANEEIVKRL